MMRAAVLLSITGMLMACTSVQPRAAASSYDCMQAVRAQLPAGLPDKRLHCLAAARIARQCSVTEAYLAGIGKELSDLLGAGDAEWADWRADRMGVRCAKLSGDDAMLPACCEQHGY